MSTHRSRNCLSQIPDFIMTGWRSQAFIPLDWGHWAPLGWDLNAVWSPGLRRSCCWPFCPWYWLPRSLSFPHPHLSTLFFFLALLFPLLPDVATVSPLWTGSMRRASLHCLSQPSAWLRTLTCFFSSGFCFTNENYVACVPRCELLFASFLPSAPLVSVLSVLGNHLEGKQNRRKKKSVKDCL